MMVGGKINKTNMFFSWLFFVFCLALKLVVTAKYSDEEDTQEDQKQMCVCSHAYVCVQTHLCVLLCST